jgi:hypothetical protein
MEDPNLTGMRTRSRAAQATAAPSAAAANIRQLAKSARSAAVLQKQESTEKASLKDVLTEEQQKQSVKALFDCRSKLVNWEVELRSILESGIYKSSSEYSHNRYASIRSCRQFVDHVTESMAKGTTSRSQIDMLRSIIKFTLDS